VCAPLDELIPEFPDVGRSRFESPQQDENRLAETTETNYELTDLAEVAEWQTRRIQNPLLARV
jgi:hypothetical protein